MRLLSLLIFIFSSNLYADNYLSGNSNISRLWNKAVNAWSGSSKLAGVEEKYSKGDCRELVESFLEKNKAGELNSFAYFRKEFTKMHITDSKPQNKEYSKSVHHIGLGQSYQYQNTSMDTESGPHIDRNCLDFMTIGESLIYTRTMRYPTYENGKKMNQVDIETKLCRETTLGLDELQYKVIFCEGDQKGYSEI